jgi:hypothetical protein
MTPQSFSALARRSALDDGAPIASAGQPALPVRRRLGLGAPVAYGWALGPLLLLAVWALGSAPAGSTTDFCRRPGSWSRRRRT